MILLGIGLWIMVGLRFYPIVKLGSAFKPGCSAGRKSKGAGEISPFAALSTALSGQVGTGNLAGVAHGYRAWRTRCGVLDVGHGACSAWRWASRKAALAIRYREKTRAERRHIAAGR